MTDQREEYLWDPKATSDAEIAAFERVLEPFSAKTLGLAQHAWTPPVRRRTLKLTIWSASIAILSAAVMTSLWFYRLAWPESEPWHAITAGDRAKVESQWGVGERLITGAGQTTTIDVARIGSLTVSENSNVQLLLTRKGRHRVHLAHGHLHAKIWAPPTYFGVESDSISVIDMGCEFDLRIDRSQTGSLSVSSGWVRYRNGPIEIAVPAGYTVNFDIDSAALPIRDAAPEALRTRFDDLVRQLADGTATSLVEEEIASLAEPADYYTLMRLLVEHPSLAAGPLYAALGAALDAPQSAEHRGRWAEGDTDARNEWWKHLPTSPKTWWVNWRDAF